MKRLRNILFLLIFSVSAFTLSAQEQADLPMACIGHTERYGVKGFNGISDFDWTITDPDGNVLQQGTDYTLLARGDSIDIFWREGMKGGIYTLTVVEHTDYGCTGSPYSVNVVLNTPEIFIPITNNIPDEVGICFGDIATLDPGEGFINYLWQDGSTNQVYYTGESGTYVVRLVDATNSCSYDVADVVVHPLPEVDLGNDTSLMVTQTLELDVYNPDFTIYDWSTGAITPSITVDGQSGDQLIWVKVTDANGCSNSDSIQITATDFSRLRIPAAFTPNKDGVNDYWDFPAPYDGKDLREFISSVNVKVFNRWGKLVWSHKGAYQPWDGKDLNGKELPMDSYHYIIEFTVGQKKYEYKGSVTIIR
ncbi:T9SS type B sorting domain-containing protein [Tenuifilum thalassicum]|uniref:Gliding motility-associated C-terminal domain-containing protein n=1 Tax=Tenuifilum thalassicum TaxID=2590900 RepID=A0A7D3XEJ2_9BACT|nr:gliding motility-associated C-terminal domain-containing protein [Tenuifilum thalassicum]QKG78917.1 gliding motility-associated C-terminal domain-containing protein [Tenuifilum thalassicum]